MGIAARQAVVADAEELTRLREVMISTFGPVLDHGWREPCAEAFRAALADPGGPLQAFVTDAPDQPGMLAAGSVGVIQQRLPGPANPSGTTGYILSVATDPRFRRQGHARAVVVATLDWLRSRHVPRVDLHASEQGEWLYRDLGFHEPRGLALTAWLEPAR
ncbi:GNAT family N-acetyltransferase [Actinocrinis puniceicyclus]|uniref:GNAT family N-acetyltransferase n=1 Tax=Actinocrinis puniceicyclus TaxID=977794 RepID=A0A8J7WKA6_9ACTN|nr:GNAT family N-acetyltransferase [Actinocrinis puniceicyclus]MBS2962435.1 GNAT family N-acetyltransferase [Actinocrinis puniceicyclus]